MVTKENYRNVISKIGLKNLDTTLQETHEFLKEATSDFTDWSLCEEDPDIKETVRIYFQKLSEFDNRNKNSSSSEKKTATAKGKAQRKSETINTDQTSHKTKQKSEIHHTESLDLEVKFIKRFVGMHNRVKTKNTILNFVKALQKAIVQKIIRKSSRYSKEIEFIQKTLVEAFNRSKGDIQLAILESDLPHFVAIAGGEKVYPSIGFIKRFIGMEGRPVETEKRKNFIKSIENALNKNKLSDDPYEGKVKSILAILKKIKSERTSVSVGHEELSGLKGIVNGCGCEGTRHKNAARKHKGLSGIVSASELANEEYVLLPFTGKWQNLFGRPAQNFSLMLHGEPGSGKTTFMMQFVKYLSSLGNVIFISSEEYGSPTLQAKIIEYLNPIPQNIDFGGTVNKSVIGNYSFVVLDSINDLNLGMDEFKKLKNQFPETAFVFLVQHTKNGLYRGSKEWEHEAQMVAEVAAGTIKLTKNRFGGLESMYFFN